MEGKKDPEREIYTRNQAEEKRKEGFLLFTLKFFLLRKSDVFFHSLELVLTPTL